MIVDLTDDERELLQAALANMVREVDDYPKYQEGEAERYTQRRARLESYADRAIALLPKLVTK